MKVRLPCFFLCERGDRNAEALAWNTTVWGVFTQSRGREYIKRSDCADKNLRENRSSPSRSRPVPVNVPVSRPLSSLVTARVTSVSVSRPPRKSLPPSALPSSLPSSAFYPSVVVTGVPTLVNLTLSPPRRAASVVPSLSEYVSPILYYHNMRIDHYPSLSPLPVVPVSLPRPPSSVSSSLLVSRMPTPPPPVRPRPSRTLSRPLSLLSATLTDSSPPTCGRRLSSSAARWRSLVTFCVRASDTRRLGF